MTLELGDVQGLFARGYGDLKSAAFLLLKVEDAAAARRWLGETSRDHDAPRTAAPSTRSTSRSRAPGSSGSGCRRTPLATVLERVRRRDDDAAPDADPRRPRRERARAAGIGAARPRPSTPCCSSTRRTRRASTPLEQTPPGLLARPAARHRRPRRLRAVRLPRRDLAAVRRGARQDRPARADRPRRRVPARLRERVRPDDRRAPAPQRQLPRLPPAAPGRRRLLALRRRGHAPRPTGAATRTRGSGSPRRWSAAGRAAPRSRSRRTRTIRASPTRTTSATTRTTRAAPAARSARTSAARTRATRSTRIPAATRSFEINRRHRIVRRGREYGPPLPLEQALTGDDSAERGLHFICLNANIARQFEFVNHTWLNNPKFGELYDDADPFFAPGLLHDPHRRRPRARDATCRGSSSSRAAPTSSSPASRRCATSRASRTSRRRSARSAPRRSSAAVAARARSTSASAPGSGCRAGGARRSCARGCR